MDLKCGQRGLCLFLYLLLAIHHVDLKSVGPDCRQCKPGYYASRLCTESHDTVCKPCPRGTFMPDQNKFKTCYPCAKCDAGYFVSKACTLRSDTICKSCSAVNGDVTEKFLRSCRHIQGDDPGENTRSEDLRDVKLDKADADETDKTSSDLITVPEGSGTGIAEETVDNQYPVVIATEEVEGSGMDITEGEDKNTTTVSVILPDDGDEDISTTTEITNVTSTSKEGTIEIGGGIILENITKSKPDIETGLLNPAPTQRPTTTVVNIVVDDSARVIVDDKTTKRIDYGEDDTKDVIDGGIIDVNLDIDNGEPRAGASHRQAPSQSEGVSTGVVITVGLLAALVFFILGFVVSRYWSRRQERTFNVQEAERRNGKPPIECSGIEYKDPENNIPAKTNIYGSMPKSKTVNGNTPEGKPQTVRTDKPITKTPAQTTGSQPDKKPESAGPTKPRAESEIRYIDEGSGDEGETDALLPSSSANQSKAGNKQEASLTNQNQAENKQEASPTYQNTAEYKQEMPSSDQNKDGSQQEASPTSQNTAEYKQEMPSSNENKAGSQQETSSTNQNKPENKQEEPSTNQNKPGNQQEISSANQNKPGNEQEKSSANENKPGNEQEIEKAPQPDVVSSAEANYETEADEKTPMISKSSTDNS